MESLSILPPSPAAPVSGGEGPSAPDKSTPKTKPRLSPPARDRLRHLTGVMVIARQEARSSAAAVRRARRQADRASEALALLDLAYHRCRHRLARRSATGLKLRLALGLPDAVPRLGARSRSA